MENDLGGNTLYRDNQNIWASGLAQANFAGMLFLFQVQAGILRRFECAKLAFTSAAPRR